MAQRQFRSDDTSVWQEKFGNGSDESVTYSGSGSDPTANTTFTGTAAGTSGTAGSGTGFAANNLVLIHQTRGSGAGNWELNKISSVGSGTNWTMAYDLMNTYVAGAQVYLLKQYSSVTINSGVTFSTSAWDGSKGGISAFLCNGTITVAGTISASGAGFIKDTNGILGQGQQGEGTAGAGGTTSTLANGNGGGGGDGGGGNVEGAGGGGGGNGTAGTTGQINVVSNRDPGVGGEAKGTVSLTTMVLGGGGGGGSGNGTDTVGADGANGAGIVVLIGKIITITGSTIARGDSASSAANNKAGGGGGGAGGSILFKGQTITLGSSLVTAPAGLGGSANSCRFGGDGGVGRIHADYSGTISGTTSPTLDSSQSNIFSDAGGAALFGVL